MQGLACGLLHLHADCTPSEVNVLSQCPQSRMSAADQLTPMDSPLKQTGNKSPYIALQVPQWNVANDVVEDFDAGLEYGEAERILKSVQRGDSREYLVQ